MSTGVPALAAPSACERLAQSRQRLQLALRAAPAGPGSAGMGAASDWLNVLKKVPGLDLALELGKTWWARHPYRQAAQTVADVAKAAVLPTAQRHPLALVAGAFVVGGVLAWSRPWRWLPTSALIAALLAKVMAQQPACQSSVKVAPSTTEQSGR